MPGPVFDPRPDPGARRVAYVSGRHAAHRRARRPVVDAGRRATTTPTSRGARPSSSPPRRSAGRAATGGRPTATGWPWPGSTRRRSAGGGSAIRPSRRPPRPRSPTRPPAPTTPSSPSTCSASTGRRWPSSGTGRRSRTSSTCSGPSRTSCTSPCSRATSGASRCWPSTRRAATTHGAFLDADEVWVELVPGTPGRLADGRLVMAADRDGARRLLVDGQAGHRARAAGPQRGPRPRRPGRVPRQRDRRAHRGARVAVAVRRRARAAHAASPACTAPRSGGDTVVLRSAGLDHDGSRTAVLGAGAEIASFAETPLVQPNVTLRRAASAALATAVLLPHDVADDARLPVLLDPYGGPARPAGAGGAGAVPDVAVVRRPGLRRRRDRRPGHARAGLGVGAGGAPRPGRAGARRPGRRAAGRPPTPIPASTCPGWRSGAGASAATWRRWPCCAGPTCSTPPSPARRSPSGACTTRTTPSATWATRPTTRRPTTARRCCSTPAGWSGRCCSCTGWPTTTWWRRTRCSCRRRCWRRAGPTRCCRCRASPT